MPSLPRKQAVTTLGEAEGVRRSYFDDSSRLPLVIAPESPIPDVCEWAGRHRQSIENALEVHGAVLFRGFGVSSPSDLDRLITATSGASLPYTERTSPRTQVGGNIYTSTDYPAHQSIFLHNENSYRDRFPMKVYFCCLTPPRTGGETPIADCRRVRARLRRETLDRFAEGYLYVRNFGGGPGMSWQEAFQTKSAREVEQYCQAHHIELEWRSGDRLRTRQLRRAIARHPRTGEMVWFNHLTFFHLTTLPPAFQQVLRDEYPSDLPNQTYYADGGEIEREILDELRAAYQAETVAFAWEPGAVLLLDNILVAHGRRPFTGDRKVIVGMADEGSWDLVCHPTAVAV